ncbi:MAG: YbaN family protein [Gordonibacter sp.]|uniref:YbaN family protein n=1 Tax=Gordonibacter sp. TaxID=1968902 RepID=UPI002FCBBD17
MSFGLGALGVVLPLLPTIPFLLGAAFCFARSSKELDRWFRSTKLYREVLQGYVARRAMTLRSKIMLLAHITVMLSISFVFMASVPVGRVAVAFVWITHIVYFGFVVKTARGDVGDESVAEGMRGRGAFVERVSIPAVPFFALGRI